MSKEGEEEQEPPTEIGPIVVVLFIIFWLRPEEGYMQRIEFVLFLIRHGLLLENITSIIILLPLFIIIPLILFRKRVNAGMINFVRSQMTKQVIQEFDKDGDETLSKEEYSDFFSMMMEDFDEGEKKDIWTRSWVGLNSDALFDKYDSNKDGKLDGDEISSLILEVFDGLRNEEANQESSSVRETVKSAPSEDEIQKLDRLYNEGYLSKERYDRLKQDLSR